MYMCFVIYITGVQFVKISKGNKQINRQSASFAILKRPKPSNLKRRVRAVVIPFRQPLTRTSSPYYQWYPNGVVSRCMWCFASKMVSTSTPLPRRPVSNAQSLHKSPLTILPRVGIIHVELCICRSP